MINLSNDTTLATILGPINLISKNSSYEEFEQYIDELVKKKEEKEFPSSRRSDFNRGIIDNVIFIVFLIFKLFGIIFF